MLHDLEWLPKAQGWDPRPTLHDLERLPKRTRIGPPNPSRFGAVPQKDKNGTPQLFTIWWLFLSSRLTTDFLLLCHLHSAVGRSQGFPPGVAAPNPSLFGVAPPPFTILEWLPKRTRIGPPQPFTIWSGSPKGQRWDAPTLVFCEFVPSGLGFLGSYAGRSCENTNSSACGLSVSLSLPRLGFL